MYVTSADVGAYSMNDKIKSVRRERISISEDLTHI